jgi:hypothetical protein
MHAGRWMAAAAVGSMLTLGAGPLLADGGGGSSGGGLAKLLSILTGGGGGAPSLPGGGLPELPGGGGLPALPGLPGGGDGGGGGDGDTFSCRASAVRVEAGDLIVEPVVANDAGVPCTADEAGVQDLVLPLGLGTATAAYADTTSDDDAFAESGVLTLTLNLGETTIDAEVLTAEATGSCVAGQPDLTGSSNVVYLAIDGEEVVELPPDGEPIPIEADPLLNLYLNQQVEEDGQLTQRALRLEALDGSVIVTVAEAIADVHGNPCEEAPPPPQCSDGIDNDGDGKIDYPADPGCKSPEDDDERCPVCPPKTPTPEPTPEPTPVCKNRSGGGDDTNPGSHGNDAGCNNPGKGKGQR